MASTCDMSSGDLSVNTDVSPFPISNYQTYNQGKFTASVRKSYRTSTIWEGLFIDLMGKKLLKLITIGNLYRPPRDNNNNINIESFIGEITSIVDEIVKQCAYALVLGDFSIYLLQINEREKFNDFPI